MVKIGRPSLSDKPSRQLAFRVSEEEFELFTKKVEVQRTTKSKVLRELVKKWNEE